MHVGQGGSGSILRVNFELVDEMYCTLQTYCTVAGVQFKKKKFKNFFHPWTPKKAAFLFLGDLSSTNVSSLFSPLFTSHFCWALALVHKQDSDTFYY